jgi:hypothetical protein
MYQEGPRDVFVLLVALFSVILVATLTFVCLMNARAIRRDVDQRYKELGVRLEEEANALVDGVFREDKRA